MRNFAKSEAETWNSFLLKNTVRASWTSSYVEAPVKIRPYANDGQGLPLIRLNFEDRSDTLIGIGEMTASSYMRSRSSRGRLAKLVQEPEAMWNQHIFSIFASRDLVDGV